MLELRDVHGYHFSNQEESMEVWKVIVMLSAQTITNVSLKGWQRNCITSVIDFEPNKFFVIVSSLHVCSSKIFSGQSRLPNLKRKEHTCHI